MTFFIIAFILFILFISQRKIRFLQSQIENQQAQLTEQIDSLKVDLDSNISTIESLGKELGELQAYVDCIENKIELNSLSSELFDNPTFKSGIVYQIDKYTSHYMTECDTQELIDDSIRACTVEIDSFELSLFKNH